ncbi:MAG: heavy metal-binding domain-containing protein, partial [Undibacterium sp.]|nr:heavy metal-binding domain-containing protein [Undibacterium sp.]
MKTKSIPLLIGITLVTIASGIGLYRLGLNRGAQQAAISDATEKKAVAAERKILYWHDPMSPTTKFDKPGKSPFMDMQLVPVYADEGADEGAGNTSAVT